MSASQQKRNKELHARIERLEADLARVEAEREEEKVMGEAAFRGRLKVEQERDAARAEALTCLTERDALRDDLASATAAMRAVEEEGRASRVEAERLRTEGHRLVDEKFALMCERDTLRAEVERLRERATAAEASEKRLREALRTAMRAGLGSACIGGDCGQCPTCRVADALGDEVVRVPSGKMLGIDTVEPTLLNARARSRLATPPPAEAPQPAVSACSCVATGSLCGPGCETAAQSAASGEALSAMDLRCCYAREGGEVQR